MNVNNPHLIAEDAARALFRRAAELQLEAAERPNSPSAAGILAREESVLTEAFRMEDVEAAAHEVGIAPEFLRLARADLAGGFPKPVTPPRPWEQRLMRRIFREPETSLAVRRNIAAAPEAVYQAIQQVFSAAQANLVLSEVIGDDPLGGAVLVFAAPPRHGGMANFGTLLPQRLADARIRRLGVVIQPRPNASCEVSLHCDLARGRKSLVRGTVGMAAGATVWPGLLLGAALTGGIGVASLSISALTAGAAGAGLVAWSRWLMRELPKSLEYLLELVDVNARAGSRAAPRDDALPPSSTPGV